MGKDKKSLPTFDVRGDNEEYLVGNFFKDILNEFKVSPPPGGKKITFITVSHFVPTLPYFLTALSQIGRVIGVIAKGSTHDKEDTNGIRKLISEKYPIFEEAKTMLASPRSAIPFMRSLLTEPDQLCIIIDIGGYFAPCLKEISKEFSGKILAIIEDTENGLQKYEKALIRHGVSSLIPLYSVARGKLKDMEDRNVGISIVNSTDRLLNDGAYTRLEDMRNISIMGYGKVGKSIAESVAARGIQNIFIYDTSPSTSADAASRVSKYTVAEEKDRSTFLRQARMLFCATGNRSLAEEDFYLLGDNVFIASATSPDDEFDLSCLEKYAVEGTATTSKEISVFVLSNGNRINLLRRGLAVNFANGAVNGASIYAVQAELIVSAIRILNAYSQRPSSFRKTPAKIRASIQILPSPSVKEVGRWVTRNQGDLESVDVLLINKSHEKKWFICGVNARGKFEIEKEIPPEGNGLWPLLKDKDAFNAREIDEELLLKEALSFLGRGEEPYYCSLRGGDVDHISLLWQKHFSTHLIPSFQHKRLWGTYPQHLPPFALSGDFLTVRNSLDDSLKSEVSGSLIEHVTSIQGTSGRGKTAVAMEVMTDRHFWHIPRFWFDANDLFQLDTTYYELAIELNLIEYGASTEIAIEKVKSYLEQHPRWLLIYDNADDRNALARYVPKTGGHVLVTSSNAHWRVSFSLEEKGDGSEMINLIMMLVKNEAESSIKDMLQANSAELARAIGKYPLLISLAVTHLQSKLRIDPSFTIQQYLETIRSSAVGSSPEEIPPSDHHKLIALCVDAVKKENPDAYEILEYLAYCSLGYISKELFKKIMLFDPTKPNFIGHGEYKFSVALGTLWKRLFVSNGATIQVHSLLRQYIIDSNRGERETTILENTLNRLKRILLSPINQPPLLVNLIRCIGSVIKYALDANLIDQVLVFLIDCEDRFKYNTFWDQYLSLVKASLEKCGSPSNDPTKREKVISLMMGCATIYFYKWKLADMADSLQKVDRYIADAERGATTPKGLLPYKIRAAYLYACYFKGMADTEETNPKPYILKAQNALIQAVTLFNELSTAVDEGTLKMDEEDLAVLEGKVRYNIGAILLDLHLEKQSVLRIVCHNLHRAFDLLLEGNERYIYRIKLRLEEAHLLQYPDKTDSIFRALSDMQDTFSLLPDIRSKMKYYYFLGKVGAEIHIKEALDFTLYAERLANMINSPRDAKRFSALLSEIKRRREVFPSTASQKTGVEDGKGTEEWFEVPMCPTCSPSLSAKLSTPPPLHRSHSTPGRVHREDGSAEKTSRRLPALDESIFQQVGTHREAVVDRSPPTKRLHLDTLRHETTERKEPPMAVTATSITTTSAVVLASLREGDTDDSLESFLSKLVIRERTNEAARSRQYSPPPSARDSVVPSMHRDEVVSAFGLFPPLPPSRSPLPPQGNVRDGYQTPVNDPPHSPNDTPIAPPTGLLGQPVVGDGHCLYRAVSYYLSFGDDVASLRRSVAEKLEQNIDQARGFIVIPEGKTVEQYIEDIRGTNAWAGDLEINTLMRVLGRPIVVIDPEGEVRNRHEIAEFQGEPIFVRYNDEDHYDALILDGTRSSTDILVDLTRSRTHSPTPM